MPAANPTGTVTIAYDNRGRVNSVTDVFGQVVSYAYDTNSNRTQLSLNGATSATYQYDVINRLTQLADNASLNTTFAYDATNKLTARTLPNGVATSYQYDGLDRLTRLTHSKAGNTLADFQYQFNAVGNITQMTDGAGASNYSYDPLDRLTAATHPNQTNESYTLNDVGNRTASQQGSSYSYQAFNRLVAANGESFGYDANGSLSSKADASGSWTYSWDYENRLRQASKASGVTVSYAYDALGRRVQRTSTAGGTTKFVYDGADVMRDLDDNGVTVADYLNAPGIDNKLRQSASGTVSYFVTDHLGTTRAFTDASGTLTSSLTYDSFGNVVSGSAATRYTYTGREFDSETGLIYYRARWYDPREGRFVSEDPIGLEGGLNFYSYADHSPTLFSDPTGLQKTSPWNSWPPQKPLKSWTCEELIQGIWEAVDTLKKRASDLIYDPQNLQWYHWTIPHPRFGSVQGHRQQYEGWRSRLDEQLKKWYDKCKDKGGPQPPCEAKEWAKTPAPVPVIRESPEERRLREKANYHRNIAIGAGAAGAFALAGVVVVGGATGALIGVLAF